MALQFPDVDEDLVKRIVDKLKSQGIFDQFRKDCLADVDSRPACQNLKDKVNGAVADFLSKQPWKDDLNKNQVRESLRKHVQQHYLEVGVNKIVEQVVNPKIFSVFMPKVEDVVYQVLGIEKPTNAEDRSHNRLRFLMSNSVSHTSPGNVFPEILPPDLDPISPGSINESGNESANLNDSVASKTNDEADNASRDLNKESNLDVNEASNESKVSGISELSSHGSTTKLDISESAHLPGDKPEIHSDVNSIHNRSNAGDADKSKGAIETGSGTYDFDNFSNLKEKLLKTDPLNKNLDKDKSDTLCNVITKDNLESVSTVKDLSERGLDKLSKSPSSCLYSEDSVGSNCSHRSKLKTEKLHLFNESTRNSLVMDCEESSVSFDKKLERGKSSEFASCIESAKEESQMSIASNDSRKFSNFGHLNLINENSQNRSGPSSPDASKSVSDKRREDNRRSSSYRRSRDGHDSRHRSRNSSRDRKYSKSRHDSKKYSSSSRDKHTSRSKDERHRSDSKNSKTSSNENSKKEKDSRHSSSYDDRKRDKDYKSGDDKNSRNRGKDSQNSSDEDKKIKRNETKSQDYKASKQNPDKNLKEKENKSSSENKTSSKRSLDDQKSSRSRESDSKYSCSEDQKNFKDKTSKTPDDCKNGKTKDESKNSGVNEKDRKSTRYKDSKQTEEVKIPKKIKDKNIETDEDSKTSEDKLLKNKTDFPDKPTSVDKKPSTDRKSENPDKKKSTDGNSKKDDKESRKRKRENCSDESDKKDHRRSRDRDDGGHRNGGSSRDHKEPCDKKRKGSSSSQEKSVSNSSKESSAKDQVESNKASLPVQNTESPDDLSVPSITPGGQEIKTSEDGHLEKPNNSKWPIVPVENVIETILENPALSNATQNFQDEILVDDLKAPIVKPINSNTQFCGEVSLPCIENTSNLSCNNAISYSISVKSNINVCTDVKLDLKEANSAPLSSSNDSLDMGKDTRLDQEINQFYGFDQLSVDKSFKWAINFETCMKRTYGSDCLIDIYVNNKYFSLTDDNLNNLPFKNGLPPLTTNNSNNVCNMVLIPSGLVETSTSNSVLSPVTKTSMNILNEKAEIPEENIISLADNACNENLVDLGARAWRKTLDSLDDKISELSKTAKDLGHTKANEDLVSLSESSSSDRGFTLPPVTEDMLDNFMMENITDKLDSCYDSSDSEVEELTVPVVPDAVILNNSYHELSTLRGVPQIEGVSIASEVGPEKIESRVSQRYNDTDLYKPRPLISNPSRRNRVSSKNGSKPSRGTKRSGDSIEFSENKRPR